MSNHLQRYDAGAGVTVPRPTRRTVLARIVGAPDAAAAFGLVPAVAVAALERDPLDESVAVLIDATFTLERAEHANERRAMLDFVRTATALRRRLASQFGEDVGGPILHRAMNRHRRWMLTHYGIDAGEVGL